MSHLPWQSQSQLLKSMSIASFPKKTVANLSNMTKKTCGPLKFRSLGRWDRCPKTNKPMTIKMTVATSMITMIITNDDDDNDNDNDDKR